MRRLGLFFFLLLTPVAALATDFVTVGTTSVCHDVFVSDSTSSTGAGLASVAFDAAGLVLKFKRNSASGSGTTVTKVDGTVGTWVDNSWKEIGNGWYQICLPDATYATGARYVSVWAYGATNMAPVNLRVVLTAATPPVDCASISGDTTAADNLESGYDGTGYAGGTTKQIVNLNPGTGTGQISLSSGAVTAGTVSDKTGYALSGTQTFNVTGNITGNLSGSCGSVTTVSDKTGYSLSGAGIDALLDNSLSNNTTAGTAGKALADAASGVGGAGSPTRKW